MFRLAYDWRIDLDGAMHVESSVVSSTGVSQYRGYEVNDYRRLGLSPDQTYSLFRPAEELEKARRSLEGKPVLSSHRPQTASDYEPDLTVGCVGHPVIFDGRSLLAPLTIWSAEDISLIKSGEKRALSCSYRYTASPEPGRFNGIPYTHVMRNISFNHLAICEVGRVPTAFVGDALPATMKAKPMQTDPGEFKADQDCFTKLNTFLQEHLPEDVQSEADDLVAQLVAELTGKNELATDAKLLVRVKERTLLRDDLAFAKRFPVAAQAATRRF